MCKINLHKKCKVNLCAVSIHMREEGKDTIKK